MKRGIVISGGGSKGAWAGGIVDYLINEKKVNYDVCIGTSTGGLLTPLISLGETQRLKEAYTNVTNKDIFTIAPYNDKGKIRIFNAIWRILRGKLSLGEQGGLEKLIPKFFTEEDYIKTINQNKIVGCTVTNYTTGQNETKLQYANLYENYCEWMLATSAVPIVFDVIYKNLQQYLDGGVTIHCPIKEALLHDCTEVDVIVLRTKEPSDTDWIGNNMYDIFNRTINILTRQISEDDVMIGMLEGTQQEVKLNFHYTPYQLTDNSSVFNKEQMLKWWNEAYEYTKTHTPEIKYLQAIQSIQSIASTKNLKFGQIKTYKYHTI